MKYEQDRLICGQDVDGEKKITEKALLEMLSNISMMHSWEIGQTTDEGISPVSWVVLNWKMEIYLRPKMFQVLHIATWISAYTKIRACREYLVTNASGESVAKATAVWVALDGEKGTFRRLSPELMGPFEPDPEQKCFPDFQFREIEKISVPSSDSTTVRTFRVIPQMLDYNGHVHNSEYLNLAVLALPDALQEQRFCHVEVYYKLQILPNETVKLVHTQDGETHYISIEAPDGTGVHALVILS